MERLANEIKSLYGVPFRKLRRGTETVAIDIHNYGILVTSDSSLMNNKMHCVQVESHKLDNRQYCNTIIAQVFWFLIEAGYLHELRNDRPGFFRMLIMENGWAKKIIDKRLERWGDLPKYQNLVRINKEYLDNLSFNFQRKPWFFDFLWI